MRKIGSFGFAVVLTVLTSTAIAQGPPPAPPTPLAAPEGYHQPEYDTSARSKMAAILDEIIYLSGRNSSGCGFSISINGKIAQIYP